MRVLAIDPGIRSPGVALFSDGVLVAAARITVPAAFARQPLGRRVLMVAERIRIVRDAWAIGSGTPANLTARDKLVLEWPQIYTRNKSKGNPNELLKTLAVGVAAITLLAGDAEILTPQPGEWAGQTKKATTGDAWNSERARMVARRLSPAERACVPAQHDAIDAVALGLWACGRFEPIRVNAGAVPG